MSDSDRAKFLKAQLERITKMAREAELLAQRGPTAMYEVYTTNADLEQVKVVFQTFHRDMAETKMFLLFRDSGYGTDYMLYNRESQEAEELCLTVRTKTLRGECQG